MKWFKKLLRGSTVNPNKNAKIIETEIDSNSLNDNGYQDYQRSEPEDGGKFGGQSKRQPRSILDPGQGVCIKCKSKSGTCALCSGLNRSPNARRKGAVSGGLSFCDQITLHTEEENVVKKSLSIEIVLKKHAKQLESLISSSMSSTNASINVTYEGTREILDPDEFFHDPIEVNHYKEQKFFSDWIIVGNSNDAIEKCPSVSSFTDTDFGSLKSGANGIDSLDIIDEVVEGSFVKVEKPPSLISLCSYEEDDMFGLFYCCETNENTITDSGNMRCCVFKNIVLVADGESKLETGTTIEQGNKQKPGLSSPKQQRSAKHIDKQSEEKKFEHKNRRKVYKKDAIAGSLMGPLRQRVSESSIDLSPSEINAMDYFGLNDNGDIIIHFDHIVVETGLVINKSRKMLCSNVKRGLEIYEGMKIRMPFCVIIVKMLKFMGEKFKCHPRNKTASGGPGDSIEAYALSLASDRTSTFARNVENFISCTKESRESTPQVVMRNMRQFMSGMKNYLVKHGEGDFAREVQLARSKLKSDEFLNLDTILESVMHRLIVLPLREHLYALFVDYYTRSNDIQLLVENVKYAANRTPTEFGIRASVTPPKTASLRQISLLLLKLQEVELPLEKLDLLLAAITAIFESTGSPRGQQLSADDFLPLLVFVVAKCGFIGAEIEAEFMWGLLQPSLLSGEAGYYLTALCSAVHVLKSFMTSDSDGTGSLDWRSSSLPACSSVLRVIIPDELNGSLQTRTLPVRPHTTTKEVCRIIAHKARITNPQDYGLFKLLDGEETILLDNECPQDARIAARGKHCILAYKRIDAKIAWPTSTASFQ